MFTFLKWLFKSLGPYALGIILGVAFAILLMNFVYTKENFSKWKSDTSLFHPLNFLNLSPQETQPEKPNVPIAQPIQEAKPSLPPKEETIPTQKKENSEPIPTLAEPIQPPKEVPVTPVVKKNIEQPAPTIPMASYTIPQEPNTTTNTTQTQDSCGTVPYQPGYAMNKYLSCKWQQDCLSRIERAKEMIRLQRSQCPNIGPNAQACYSYYAAMEAQYQTGMCKQWQTFNPAGGYN
ncbi:MAG: hypothetical protein H7832_08645 [Magnetococcus sp. DMHC-6]